MAKSRSVTGKKLKSWTQGISSFKDQKDEGSLLMKPKVFPRREWPAAPNGTITKKEEESFISVEVHNKKGVCE